MRIESYASRDALMRGVAAAIAVDLAGVVQAEGLASFSVPGGTTPGPVFDLLADMPLDWAHIAVFLNDERWVGEDNPRSNTRLLRQRLFVGRAAAARLIPLYAEALTPEMRLAELAAGLVPHLPVSVLLLGMGADMHTASLFPGADHLAEALADDAPVLMALRAEAAGEPRVTLTAPVLLAARHVHILITGEQKRRVIEQAAHLPLIEAPVRLVLDRATIHWAE